MTDKQQRLPRFTRDPEAAGSFQVTQRDLEILRHVAEHRFIRSEWIIKLVGGSRQQLLRRLNLLYHHAYLARPRAQLDYYHEGGSKSLVYGLASRGAGRLRRDLNMPFERMDWTTRNRKAGRLFMEHTVMVSSFMASLELDCRKREDVRLVYSHEMFAIEANPKRFQPFRWNVQVSRGRRVGIVPDKIFALEIRWQGGRIKRIPYFLEADRGSMPIKRSFEGQSSIASKLKAYLETHRKKVLRTQRITRFRLLIITNSIDRAKNINDISDKMGIPPGLVLATPEHQLSNCKSCLLEIAPPLGHAIPQQIWNA